MGVPVIGESSGVSVSGCAIARVSLAGEVRRAREDAHDLAGVERATMETERPMTASAASAVRLPQQRTDVRAT